MAFVVGSLVYGPVLGKPWAKAMQQEKRDEKWAEASIQRKGMLSLFIVNAFLQFLQVSLDLTRVHLTRVHHPPGNFLRICETAITDSRAGLLSGRMPS